MCSSVVKIITASLIWSFSLLNAYAVDTAHEEKFCEEIGFKKKTPEFGNCVLNFLGRIPKNKDTVASDNRLPNIELQAHALVIGNSNYRGASRLINPTNDARAVSQKLRSLGFIVTEVLDANLSLIHI